jgi:DNA processing protein
VTGACDLCLRRAWLLSELAGHLDPVRARIAELLALDDEKLVAAVGGRRRDRLMRRVAGFAAGQARDAAERSGVELICRCDPAYPVRLLELPSAPAVLHVAGGAERFLAAAASEPVAIVGSRKASAYGAGVARSLARSLSAAGVPVISGMALGIDSAAHQGMVSAPGERALAVAVLPGPADEPYPRSARGLYRQILKRGTAVSELPPRVTVRSWMFLARNRIIAGLAAMTIVVEATAGSGALVTARHAAELGREVGAVPGRITAPQAAGPNRLINDGARVIADPQDILDLLFEAGTRTAPPDDRPELSAELRSLLAAIEAGHDSAAALVRQGILPATSLAALASLELAGYVRRGAGGRFSLLL